MTKSFKENRLAFIIAIVSLVLLVSVSLFYFQQLKNINVVKIPLPIQKELDEWFKDLKVKQNDYEKQRNAILVQLESIAEKSDDWKLKNQLRVQLEQNILELKTLENDIANYRDTSDLERIKLRVSLTDIQHDNFIQYNKLSGDLVMKFDQMYSLQNKIDSLNGLISNLKITSSESGKLQKQIANLEDQKIQYQQQIARLKTTSLELERQVDSFKNILESNKASIAIWSNKYDSLLQAYADLKEKAQRNGELATKMNLWYFEKDNIKKPRRRFLVNENNDYNRGRDIRTIHGEFSISYDLFKPLTVANIYLYKKDLAQPITESKMTVRNQASCEFNLITGNGLDKGEYAVSVEYDGSKILEQKFFVSN
ncbi:MAG: hypothetical protein KDC92_01500 [Bacteroidetes bacterium]|nr:hypothetical protein [Bacteroidota bacterium]